jgi:hypothetical protein
MKETVSLEWSYQSTRIHGITFQNTRILCQQFFHKLNLQNFINNEAYLGVGGGGPCKLGPLLQWRGEVSDADGGDGLQL